MRASILVLTAAMTLCVLPGGRSSAASDPRPQVSAPTEPDDAIWERARIVDPLPRLSLEEAIERTRKDSTMPVFDPAMRAESAEYPSVLPDANNVSD
jgi:hypothetical protein